MRSDEPARFPLAFLTVACMAAWFVLGLGISRVVAWWFAPG